MKGEEPKVIVVRHEPGTFWKRAMLFGCMVWVVLFTGFVACTFLYGEYSSINDDFAKELRELQPK